VTIHEPATLITDALLAALAAGCSRHLYRHRPAANRAARWWGHALALTAASALVGGLYHGFAPNFPAARAVWWVATLMLLCLGSAAMGCALVHEAAVRSTAAAWFGAVVIKFTVAAVVLLVRPEFVVGIADYGAIMLAWALAAGWLRRGWSGWMLAAIACSALAALVQQARWSVSPGFNHNDLYHVVQAFAILGFHRAGLRLGGAAEGSGRVVLG
jgi:hypothetical protein